MYKKRMPCDVLLIAAFHPELAPLRAVLGEALEGAVGGRRVVARAAGIGVVMAAAGAAMMLPEHAPRRVVLVGTCGTFASAGDPGALGIGDVAVPSRVHLTAPCVVDGLAQFPEPMSVERETDPDTTEALLRAGGKPADVATTLGITVDDAAAARVSRGARSRVEHLEAHGVATACSARGVPFAAALGVANVVGARGRAEWLANHRAASKAAIDVVLRWLGGPLV